MSETLFQLVAEYGVWLLAASCYLSCLLVPIPSSLLMLAGGAFVASGDLELSNVIAGAWLGAVLGDQTGYNIGRLSSGVLARIAGQSPKRKATLARAHALVDRRGSLGVFFSTWLVAPLGPWVNFIAGATGLGWAKFTLWDAAGEAIWVLAYVGLGYGFAGQLSAVAEFASNASGFLVAVALALGFGALLVSRARRPAKALRD